MEKDAFGLAVCEYDGERLLENTVEEWLSFLDERDDMERWMIEHLHEVRGRLGLRQLVAACPVCCTMTLNLFFAG